MRPSQAGLYMLPLSIVAQLTEPWNTSDRDVVGINNEGPKGRPWRVGAVYHPALQGNNGLAQWFLLQDAPT